METKQMLTPKLIMGKLKISYPSLLRRVKSNEIPFVKVGNKLLFPSSYVQQLEEQAYSNLKGGSND